MKERNEFGYLDISDYVREEYKYQKHFKLTYNDKEYYYKDVSSIGESYNELIAEEIANELGIPCCHYDLATYADSIGYISESQENKYDRVFASEIIIPKETLFQTRTSLEQLWDSFTIKYKESEIIKRLMDDMVKIFLFDNIIGNSDRHIDNILIAEKDNIPYIYPIIDNQIMLEEYCIYDGLFCLGVDDESYSRSDDLLKFLRISSKEYLELLKSYLWVLDSNNIENVLQKVETRIGCSMIPKVRKRTKDNFEINRQRIEKTIKKIEK